MAHNVGSIFDENNELRADAICTPPAPPYLPEYRERADIYNDTDVKPVAAGTLGINLKKKAPIPPGININPERTFRAFCTPYYFRYHAIADAIVRVAMSKDVDGRSNDFHLARKQADDLRTEFQNKIAGLPKEKVPSTWDRFIILFIHHQVSVYTFKVWIHNCTAWYIRLEKERHPAGSPADQDRKLKMKKLRAIVTNASQEWKDAITSEIDKNVNMNRQKTKGFEHGTKYIQQLRDHRAKVERELEAELVQFDDISRRPAQPAVMWPWYHEFDRLGQTEFWKEVYSLDVIQEMYVHIVGYVDIEANVDDEQYGKHLVTNYVHLCHSIFDNYMMYFVDARDTTSDDARVEMWLASKHTYQRDHYTAWANAAKANDRDPDFPDSFDTVLVPDCIFSGKRVMRRARDMGSDFRDSGLGGILPPPTPKRRKT